MRMKHTPRRSRLVLGIGSVLALFGLSMLPAIPAGAVPITPTGVTLTLTTDNAGLGGALPIVLAKTGDPIIATLTLQPAGATFGSKVTFNLVPSLRFGGTPSGAVSPSSYTLPGGTTSATFSISYTAIDNGVIVTAVPAKPNGPAAGIATTGSAPFDSLITLQKVAKGTHGFGEDSCNSGSTTSSCGFVVLPNGIESDLAALSTGICTSDLNCRPGSQIVQFVADLGILYTPGSPATLVYQCDKSLCKGKGVTSYSVNYSFLARNYDPNASEQLVPALPCATKGQANDDNSACVDYASSHRNNAGDLLLSVNFTHDIRITGG